MCTAPSNSWAAMQPQPAEWLDGRADTRSPNLNTEVSGRGWAHNSSHYLCYALCECRHVVSNVLVRQVVIAITLTPVQHKRHMQFLTSAPNFRGSSWPPDPPPRALPKSCWGCSSKTLSHIHNVARWMRSNRLQLNTTDQILWRDDWRDGSSNVS